MELISPILCLQRHLRKKDVCTRFIMLQQIKLSSTECNVQGLMIANLLAEISEHQSNPWDVFNREVAV